MIKIVRATIKDCDLLIKLSEQTFWESHGNSASKDDIETFINKTYSIDNFLKELMNSINCYHILYFNNEVAGYSKIVFNSPNINVNNQNITKLDRLYLLKKFYGNNLGEKLLNFNIELSKLNNNVGIWLAVWVENERAIHFYNKTGFNIVGSYSFQISDTHSNPNHIMFKLY